jgi:hypothetical protein
MKIKCYHCEYEWDYRGNHPYYITCPTCRWKLSIRKLTLLIEKKEEEKKEKGQGENGYTNREPEI